MVWLAVAVGFIVVGIVHSAGAALVARLLRVPIEDCSIGWGPRLLRFTVVGVPIRIGLMPTGSYVKLSEDAFQRLPRFARAGFCLAGPAALAGAAAIIGMWVMPMDVYEGLGRLCLHPRLDGGDIARAFEATWRESPMRAIGEFTSMSLWLNLLPLPIFNGGQALLALLSYDRADPPTWVTVAQWTTFAFALYIMVCGAIALFSA